jgi:hypothetical protein
MRSFAATDHTVNWPGKEQEHKMIVQKCRYKNKQALLWFRAFTKFACVSKIDRTIAWSTALYQTWQEP